MMFRSLLLLASVSAHLLPQDVIPATSRLGRALLSKATVEVPSRYLADNNNQVDYSWMAGFSIKYLGCNTLLQVAQSSGQNNNNNNNNKNKNQNQASLVHQNLVRFALCPSNSCTSCTGGGSYVVDMNDFVDGYTEAKLTLQEYQCEMVRENCTCANVNDDAACESQCYYAAGMSYCLNINNQDANFEVQKYLTCNAVDDKNNNNGYYSYVGPYCGSDLKSIYFAVFSDAGCTTMESDSSAYYNAFGYDLPYTTSPVVTLGDCIPCYQANNNDNNNQIADTCTEAYSAAVKCEKNMNVSYPDTTGCDYLSHILPRLESANGVATMAGAGRSGGASVAFAWIFALTTLLFGAYAYFLYRKIKRGSMGLASQGTLG